MLTVRCPHCGFAKQVPAERLPGSVVKVTCPECQASFPFGRNAADMPEPPVEEEHLAPEPKELSEAAALPKAGFWIRVAARGIDLFLMGVTVTILTLLLLSFSSGLTVNAQGQAALSLILTTFIVVVILVYDVFFLGYCGQTPGKMATRIKVVKIDGSEITFGRAFFREVIGKYVSRFLLCAGYLMVAFDAQKQGLHDKIASTYVIKL